MDLFVLPETPILDEAEGIVGALRPDFGSLTERINGTRRGWGQASSMPILGTVIQGRLVWVTGLTDEDRDVLRAVPGSRHVAVLDSRPEDEEALDAAFMAPVSSYAARRQKLADIGTEIRSGKAPDHDDVRRLLGELEPLTRDMFEHHRAPVDEWTSIYRGVAEQEELAQQDRSLRGVALTIAAADDFSGTSSDLGDRTMVGVGSHNWAGSQGQLSCASGLVSASGAGENTAYDETASAVDVQRTTVTSQGTQSGAIARWVDGANFYLSLRTLANAHQCFKKVGGTFSQVGANGTALSNGETHALDASGTSISCYQNGSLDQGPNTVSDNPTGVGAIRINTALADRISSWEWAVADAAGAAVVSRNLFVRQAVNRAGTY